MGRSKLGEERVVSTVLRALKLVAVRNGQLGIQ